MKCKGLETSTRDFIEIEGDSYISHVDPVLEAIENPVWIAPGFVDLQVNGFAGVDYNSPVAPVEEIGRSIRAMFSTGVTRFFPDRDHRIAGRHAGRRSGTWLARGRRCAEGLAMEAFHVEGPHISPTTGRAGRIRRAGSARRTSRSSAAGRTPPKAT